MKRVRGIIIAGLLIAAWIATERVLYRRTVPRANVRDIDSFLQWRPGTRQFAVLADGRHLIATGAASSVLPSGPSGYVFDRSGRLVDWSADIGDDPKFDGKWQAQHSVGSGKVVRRSELSSWLSPATQPGINSR
jgi:hypothetical protein